MQLPTKVHTQDPRHKGKLLYGSLDHSSRLMLIGRSLISHEQIRTVWRQTAGADGNDRPDHGLLKSDCDRDDQQNFETICRCTGTKARAAIAAMTEEGIHTDSMLSYLRLVSRYLLIFFGKKNTLAERVRSCAYVYTYLRLWRIHVWLTAKTNTNVTVRERFLTRQTFEHTVMSVQMALNQIRMFRDVCPDLPAVLWLLGSDCCESFFSELCGHGRVNTHARDFNYGDARSTIDDLTLYLIYLQELKDGGVNLDRKQRKGEFLSEAQEDSAMPDALLHGPAAYPSDAEMVELVEAGCEEAREEMERLGMKDLVYNYKHPHTPDLNAWLEPERMDNFNNIVMREEPKVHGKVRTVAPDATLEGEASDGIDVRPQERPNVVAGYDEDNTLMVEAAELAMDLDNERLEAEHERCAALDAGRGSPTTAPVPTAWTSHRPPRSPVKNGHWKTSLPDGTAASKRTILRILCEAYSSGRHTDMSRLPKDRRMKIVTIAQQERQDDTYVTTRFSNDGASETVSIDLAEVRPFTAVAIAIVSKDGNDTVGYGQVQKVKLDGKTLKDGVKTNHERVNDVILTVLWFQKKGEAFELPHSLPSKENLCHPMSTYLGNVDFAFDPFTRLYTLR